MIKKLTSADSQLIQGFAYKREEENMFITGAFEREKDPFAKNFFYGFFRDDDSNNEEVLGLAVFFGQWGNLNVSSQDDEIIRALTDHLFTQGHKLAAIACFSRYGEVIVKQLKLHGLHPKDIEEKTVYRLTKGNFVDFSNGGEEVAQDSDRKELLRIAKLVFEGEADPEIKKEELNRISEENEFVIRKGGKIVSKANINALSKNYFQIGGVATLEEHRRQGLAKQVVSVLCRHFLAQGKEGLLFTNNDNTASKRVYQQIGFKPFDQYMMAMYG